MNFHKPLIRDAFCMSARHGVRVAAALRRARAHARRGTEKADAALVCHALLALPTMTKMSATTCSMIAKFLYIKVRRQQLVRSSIIVFVALYRTGAARARRRSPGTTWLGVGAQLRRDRSRSARRRSSTRALATPRYDARRPEALAGCADHGRAVRHRGTAHGGREHPALIVIGNLPVLGRPPRAARRLPLPRAGKGAGRRRTRRGAPTTRSRMLRAPENASLRTLAVFVRGARVLSLVLVSRDGARQARALLLLTWRRAAEFVEPGRAPQTSRPSPRYNVGGRRTRSSLGSMWRSIFHRRPVASMLQTDLALFYGTARRPRPTARTRTRSCARLQLGHGGPPLRHGDPVPSSACRGSSPRAPTAPTRRARSSRVPGAARRRGRPSRPRRNSLAEAGVARGRAPLVGGGPERACYAPPNSVHVRPRGMKTWNDRSRDCGAPPRRRPWRTAVAHARIHQSRREQLRPLGING